MLDGLNWAPAATQIVPRLLLTEPVNVPEANNTTSVLERLRFVGIPDASGYTAVGFWQSIANSAEAGSRTSPTTNRPAAAATSATVPRMSLGRTRESFAHGWPAAGDPRPATAGPRSPIRDEHGEKVRCTPGIQRCRPLECGRPGAVLRGGSA